MLSKSVEIKRHGESKHEWLLGFNEVQRWLKEIPSEKTRYEYLCVLSKWIDHKKGMNPSELIAEAIERKKSAEPDIQNLIHREILDYSDQLLETVSERTERKMSTGSARTMYSAVRSFYRYNGIELPKFSRRIKSQAFPEHEKGYIPTPEETAKMIDYAGSIRNKAVIGFIASSGQRAGIFTALNYGHVREQLEQKDKSIIIKVPKIFPDRKGLNVNKNRTKYSFGVNKETAQYLRDMITERIRDGEPIDDESWLFRSYVRTYVWKGKNPVRVRKDEKGDPLTVEAIADIVEGAAVAIGLQSARRQMRKGERALVHPHSLRKYFKKYATKGMKEARELMLVEFFMGHKIPELEKAYPAVDFDDPDVVRGFYEQIEPSLSWIPKPVSEVERRKQSILDLARTVMPEDRYNLLESMLRGCVTGPQIDDAIERFRKGETKEIGVIELDREDCQKIVAESDLEKYLTKGYCFIATLPSGKVVVERNNH